MAALEQELLAATVSIEEQAALIEQLATRADAWLSHGKLINDPKIRAITTEITFFGSPEEHAVFFNMLNDGGVAENLVLYAETLAEREKNRKRKFSPKPGLRRSLAQDQFLMVCVIPITGDPFSFVGGMFGGVSTSTMSRIFTKYLDKLLILVLP